MSKKQSFFIFLIIFGAAIGLFDSGYLSMLEFRGQTGLACDLGGFNCDAVLTSQYSRFLNIPLAYWGLAYYSALFFLAIVYLDLRNRRILQLIELLLWSGFFVSLVLLYLQAFILRAFCLYCVISEVVVFSMILGYLILKLGFKNRN